MSTICISRTLAYLLRVCFLAALVGGVALPNHSPLQALAQSPFDGSDIGAALDYAYITAIPSANFSGAPTTGSPPLQVQFTDESTGSPTGWAWYFGDENFSAAWTQAPPVPWVQRSGHTSVVLPDGSIVLMGGYTGSDYLNDVWRSTNQGDTWIQMTEEAEWSARYSATSVVLLDGSIVLMGGFGGSSSKNDVWRSIDKGATWIQMTANAEWTARSHHASVTLPDGSIVTMGDFITENDVWRSTDQGATWTQMTANAEWSGRYDHAIVALQDGSILLMGGWDGGNKSDVWRSEDHGATWTKINNVSAWERRSGHSCVVLPDGSLVLTGGTTGLPPNVVPRNDVWRSTDQGDTWIQLTANAEWSGRSGHTSVALPDGSIVLTGGWRSGHRLRDVWRLETAGSNQQDPWHTYAKPGSYQVALQVYNAEGYSSIRKEVYITVTGSDYYWIYLPLALSNTP